MHNPGNATPERFPAQDRFADGAQFIAGRLTKGTSGRTHAVVDPATGRLVGVVTRSGILGLYEQAVATRPGTPEREDAL